MTPAALVHLRIGDIAPDDPRRGTGTIEGYGVLDDASGRSTTLFTLSVTCA